MAQFIDALSKLASESGFVSFFTGSWQNLVMIVVACVLLWLGIKKGFEPLPIWQEAVSRYLNEIKE